MTIGDLIKTKDYDYIEWRAKLPDSAGGGDTFFGASASKDGKLIELAGGCYSEDTEVISYEEWDNPEENIKNGLTIVYEANIVIFGKKAEKE